MDLCCSLISLQAVSGRLQVPCLYIMTLGGSLPIQTLIVWSAEGGRGAWRVNGLRTSSRESWYVVIKDISSILNIQAENEKKEKFAHKNESPRDGLFACTLADPYLPTPHPPKTTSWKSLKNPALTYMDSLPSPASSLTCDTIVVIKAEMSLSHS